MNIIKRNAADYRQNSPFLFDDLFSRDFFNWGQSNFSGQDMTLPSVNIRETKDNFEVELAAPGMKKEYFNIRLEDNILTIQADQRSEEEGSEKSPYSRKEFNYQSFQRSLTLSREVVDADNIVAKYEDGILKLTIPKKDEVKRKAARLIKIS